MIIHKKIQGWNEKDIAIALKISVRTVRRWWSGLKINSRKPDLLIKFYRKIWKTKTDPNEWRNSVLSCVKRIEYFLKFIR